ncbi:hypothetical protein [Thiolapillus sp.]
MTFIFEQSDTEIYVSHAGLVVAGLIINRHSGLKKVSAQESTPVFPT